MYIKTVEGGLGKCIAKPTKVAIIGAGLAGLSAAQVLGTVRYNNHYIFSIFIVCVNGIIRDLMR